MLIDGSIFGNHLGITRMRNLLPGLAVTFSLLFTFIKPEASAGLEFFPRLLFWICHIAGGLVALFLASYCLRAPFFLRLPIMLSLGITGVLGVLMASPVFYFLCGLFPTESPVDWVDRFGAQGWMQGIISEFIEAGPSMLACWYAINLPFLLNKTDQQIEPDVKDNNLEDKTEEEHLSQTFSTDTTPVMFDENERQQRLEKLYERLPLVLGKDLVAISSDLHYLNVYTSQGKTLVLGSLKYYADALVESGIQVHRSSWVAKAHIVKVHVAGNEAWCLMTNGLKVPISRSKRKEVKQFFGQTVRYPLHNNRVTPLSSA